ncbi:MAG: hypothetical protein IJN80_05655 [Clostridia bacterium]|nr:hypothetical protein [Clostridia bacterium]
MALIHLIEHHNASLFYVGNQGNFDRMVRKVLKQLQLIYPHISYYVVLAYLPCSFQEGYGDTIYPDGLERIPPRFAIDKRNRWMLDRCDYVITYVEYPFGGAAKFKALAEKRGKTVINLPSFSALQ